MTFYDNHDMARLDASDDGFIDAHNWLFTARGIPVVYYGSEIGFMRGRAEHAGNRNYFGQRAHRRRAAQPDPSPRCSASRNVRAATPALQRGLQLDIMLEGDRAAFYRVYQHDGVHQIALVLLNKGDAPRRFEIATMLQAGQWRSALDGSAVDVAEGGRLAADVAAHGVQVFVLDAPVAQPALQAALDQAMAARRSRQHDALRTISRPLEARTSSVGIRVTLSAGSSRTSRSRLATSNSPAPEVSCTTVVNGGLEKRAIGVPSKPTMATSSGTRRPCFGQCADRADRDQVAGREDRVERVATRRSTRARRRSRIASELSASTCKAGFMRRPPSRSAASQPQ